MIIAIDGPSGAGKSTVATAVARRLGFHCLDTGAMYRSIAWKAIQQGADLADEAAVGAIAQTFDIAFEHEEGDPRPSRVLIGGDDVTAAIRTAEIDRSVSVVSAHPSVRAALVEQQRRIAEGGDYVIEGRDIGTVVCPNAEVKVFLTATNEARARRRVAQNAERGVGSVDFEEVLADIIRRDELDSSRATAPLVQADDAVLVDSSDKTINEVIDAICAMADARA
ncbi:Cytidylate kinase [Slackia heliotrinireducens]|uniref:Cytidylate kinase n=1 Tax=Slackia heliotrinireducens (strain ATCC 29202 / DSM 20476 / NCTC 11029 / RHS 1) TaxID=471855 RepID=C7N519_SLAHD|nr:(d)CMP kinase [Slackia heliotrinireducens]ACV22004.1 cytidylate kinase [Slackia heliotrinireducens DSM 20476]VEG99908.1 Cytidylate kinase [Slackia heliotrinireducens]